jgi:hypothetical protein
MGRSQHSTSGCRVRYPAEGSWLGEAIWLGDRIHVYQTLDNRRMPACAAYTLARNWLKEGHAYIQACVRLLTCHIHMCIYVEVCGYIWLYTAPDYSCAVSSLCSASANTMHKFCTYDIIYTYIHIYVCIYMCVYI